MFETSKAVMRRLQDIRFATRYFVGQGIDIGSGNDPLNAYRELFPLTTQMIQPWDVQHGDAQLMHNVPDASFDFVHSSHCLEHMVDPDIALYNWVRILRPGGHLICVVPDEDLYERGMWPSVSNPDHKHTFTIYKQHSWSPVSINLIDLIARQVSCLPLKIELLDSTFRNRFKNQDQTMTPIGECASEFILQKRTG